MKGKKIIIGLIVLGVIGLGVVGWAQHRQSARRQWKNEAAAEVARLAADPSWVSQQIAAIQKQIGNSQYPTGTWFNDRVAVMGDGQWLVFRSVCGKEGRGISDLFIAKASNGRWYYSTYHFCIEMDSLRMDLRPPDLASFITHYYLREFDGRSDESLKATWPPG